MKCCFFLCYVQHQNDIVHRDVKAENILFTSNNKLVKVADFGFSTFAKATTKLNTFCGSPPYAAPELFKDDYYYGPLVDIWALGVLLYFMVVGTMPFRAETVDKLKDCILEGRYVFPSFVSQDCKILITSILRRNPRERYSIREILESSFLENIEFPEPYPACKNIPTFLHGDENDFENMEEIEKAANKQLRQLGISKDMYDKCDHKDYRNNVTGTYRIILFGMQRRSHNPEQYNIPNGNGNIGNRLLKPGDGLSIRSYSASSRASLSFFNPLKSNSSIFNRGKVSVATTDSASLNLSKGSQEKNGLMTPPSSNMNGASPTNIRNDSRQSKNSKKTPVSKLCTIL